MRIGKFVAAGVVSIMTAAAANAADSLTFNGFALLRPQTRAPFLYDDDSISAQLQLAADWQITSGLRTHVHVLGRNEGDAARRGRFGVVEAFVEQNFAVKNDRIRLMGGAFFLPTSRENVDSLWETPYNISSSALNTWMGEEFRPIGIDATYMKRTRTAGVFTLGGTVFRGDDTFGALPIDRGWAIHDQWTLLGEHVPSRPSQGIYTSVSAETDGRLGWSGRAKWNTDHAVIQYTRIDNRSDALRYGDLYNWATKFNILGTEYSWNAWTFAAESGWGSTAIVGRRGRRSSDLDASYALLSRRIGKLFRVTFRADDFKAGRDERLRAYTGSVFWYVTPKIRAGVETISERDEHRYALEFRYRL